MNKNLNEYQIERQKLSEELKPCPFCGGEARLRKHQKLEQTWYVQCNKCGMRTPNSVQPPYESWKTTMNYPVQLWNRRVEDRNDNEKVEEMLRDLPSVTLQEPKILALLDKTFDDFCNCPGGESYFHIDGEDYNTDAVYALEGMEIFIKVLKKRLVKSEE